MKKSIVCNEISVSWIYGDTEKGMRLAMRKVDGDKSKTLAVMDLNDERLKFLKKNIEAYLGGEYPVSIFDDDGK